MSCKIDGNNMIALSSDSQTQPYSTTVSETSTDEPDRAVFEADRRAVYK